MSVIWTAFSLFLATPFVIMLHYANRNLEAAILLLSVSALTSTIAGSRGAIAADRNDALREAKKSQG